ncbi:haloacid dehalogenase superfamily, subfamily IA, variant 3 with third motif having DD or ED [Gracilibacillus ureilyticus]|uniref:Haloacid dehalogenase superfamily, subfamily IA, variant 3 with third motif having DD or ED n=1 Tax=Gracilibacillus ureilyticus TaxID=531814 RepID=A0A1H9UH06_9BACI|nr:HAD-IA family hydrolase [Gracilibacillus ureilyticus]SES08551.1 haloacid dehalogenase superfamily, subfamily IA, variant 3 with third motif having DD or ED [Gracilibacillus ureilyticus]
MVKAIIFDFDGLIFDTETFELESFQQLYQKYNIEFPIESWLKGIGSSLAFDPYEQLLHCIPNIDRDTVRQERRKVYKELIADQLPRDGVVDYLKRAKQLGIMTAIASSSRRSWVDEHLDKLNLTDYFDVIFTADDAEEVKPAPDLYLKVLNHFHITPEDAIVFEDSPNGSLAAINAGISCVIVPNKTTAELAFDKRVALRMKSKNEKSLDEVLHEIGIFHGET